MTDEKNEHTWVKESDGIATIGLTDQAQKSLQDIVFIDLPQEGKNVKKGDAICSLESVKSTSDVICPVSGEVVEVNNTLNTEPELINKSPTKDGWIVKIKI